MMNQKEIKTDPKSKKQEDIEKEIEKESEEKEEVLSESYEYKPVDEANRPDLDDEYNRENLEDNNDFLK